MVHLKCQDQVRRVKKPIVIPITLLERHIFGLNHFVFSRLENLHEVTTIKNSVAVGVANEAFSGNWNLTERYMRSLARNGKQLGESVVRCDRPFD